MHTRRKLLGAAALGLVGGAIPFTLRAQGIDTAKIIVGFPPGGTTDVMARKVADKLRGPYARVSIVENRPGAGGQLGVVALKDSPAQWQRWWWLCLAGQILFIPFIGLLTGRWSPRKARQDAKDHEEAVNRELAALAGEQPAAAATT